MKQWNRFLLALSVMASFCCSLSPFGVVAYGAAPVVTVLPPFKQGTVTPTRLASDSAGNIYVTDAHAGGILKFDRDGNLLQKIKIPLTPKEPGGVAINPNNGDLLVTQGTYVVALDSLNGYTEKARFGTFKSAFSIAVDPRTTGGTNNIYVSDIADYCVQVFNNATYSPVATGNSDPGGFSGSGTPVPPKPLNSFGASETEYEQDGVNTYFNRPAGVAFDTSTNAAYPNGRVAVADSLNGTVKFFTPSGLYLNALGYFLYSATAVRFTYPQAITFEYTDASNTVLSRAYVLDTYQSFVMTLDILAGGTTVPQTPSTWKRVLDIGSYGHGNGNLIAPSDVIVDKSDPDNNRLLVTNGFGSLTVYGLNSLQPYNVAIDSITDTSMRLTWSNPTAPFNAIRVYRTTDPLLFPLGTPATKVGGDLPSSTTSLDNLGLTPYTIYYFMVRTVDTTNVEGTNEGQVSAKTTGSFPLSVTINGTGSVNGALSCAGGTCTTTLPSDSIASLTATDSAQSAFAVWTGDCFTTSHTCELSMDGPKSVTASFIKPLAFRVDGAYFDNLQDAYDAAAASTNPGTVIKVLAGTWPSTFKTTEYMTAWQGKTVIIEGGYDSTFTSNAGSSSTVTGRANLTAGKVIMKQFKVK